MNFLYTTNDKFVPQVGAGICSVCENNKDVDKINFYIFSVEIQEKNKVLLQELGKRYEREVLIIEMKALETYFKFSFDTSGWNPIVLARLLLDQLLPDNVERIIYLDGDTIVRDSLQDMWNTDMGGAVIGGCIEPTVNKKQVTFLNMEGIPYINAGVLLINMKKWREEKTGERIIKFYEKNNGRLFANDQDAINGALKGEIYYLSPRYNFYNIYDAYPYRMLSSLVKPGKYIEREIFNYAVSHPAIIHYLGEERPWRKGNKHRFRQDFKKYLELTPWSDMKFEEGWETYFKCFNLFNKIMKPFPMIRYKVITALIPSFMKFRSRKIKKDKK